MHFCQSNRRALCTIVCIDMKAGTEQVKLHVHALAGPWKDMSRDRNINMCMDICIDTSAYGHAYRHVST